MKKVLLSSFILGILALNVFSQDNGNGSEGPARGPLTEPLSGDVEFISPLSFVFKTTNNPDSTLQMPDTISVSKQTSTTIHHVLNLTKASGGTGRVGINAANPEAALHVGGAGLFSQSLAIGRSSSTLSGIANLKLRIGSGWTFSDLSYSKIMGYNCYFLEDGFQGRIMDGYAAAVRMNANNGSIQLCTAPNGITGDGNIVWGGYLTMLNNGNVGVGITNPLTKFQIGDIWTFYDGSNNKMIGRNCYYNGSDVRMQQGIASRICFDGSGDLILQTAPSGAAGSNITTWNTVAMKNDGTVGIGTTDPGEYKLKVAGKINCTEVIITASGQQNSNGDDWPDYVFTQDYSLQSLDELASYIEQNRRLPEVPSAAEVAENGIKLSEINTLLLKKVEELTLYILQQNEKISQQSEKMTDLQSQINELKKR